MQSFAIPDFADVKRINGKILNDEWDLIKLCFSKKDGSEITKVEFNNDRPYGQETLLEDDEEIIGIHGTKDVNDWITQLGFIVWKSPKY